MTNERRCHNKIMYQLSNYKDIDETVAPIIIQYYQYMNANDYKAAAQLLKNNAAKLKPYCIDMNGVNKIERGIHDLWEVATAKQTVIVTEDLTEPAGNYPVNTEWYAGY